MNLENFIRETKWAFNPPDDQKNLKRERLVHAVKQIVRKELTVRQQECFSLVIVEGKTITQSAEILGLNKSTVSRHLNRAKEIIRQALKYSYLI